jgi:hypothetical protein
VSDPIDTEAEYENWRRWVIEGREALPAIEAASLFARHDALTAAVKRLDDALVAWMAAADYQTSDPTWVPFRDAYANLRRVMEVAQGG